MVAASSTRRRIRYNKNVYFQKETADVVSFSGLFGCIISGHTGCFYGIISLSMKVGYNPAGLTRNKPTFMEMGNYILKGVLV